MSSALSTVEFMRECFPQAEYLISESIVFASIQRRPPRLCRSKRCRVQFTLIESFIER